ncbi:hypothetical protein [Cupriavidus taiwanensis]|uniref:hypothetical protein n=1 Tax=Cupriavidus taiwanensis TaxID=164546 RepID=UPI000E10C640|nr:hypothetical protein [Cupriavidus taiwanensis]SOY56436.1 conserved hypothetical protein [Cupriavidus taiwanensis]SOY57111.1 conserved hypothetical protein [Cupriavidus taiwanensis]SOY79196.1 conserved hypothetical protein [Cupriavidus taiwanensis]SOZ64600.1 conserved hypothetical protein [Cupriavidus taiwanensis]SOZ83318.1 conserved hypothetical protein [Cupriavidus taiwanensis]
MQIFTLFEARMRAIDADRCAPSDFLPGFQPRLLAAAAGLGCTCDYIFLCAGERQPEFSADCHEWWGCLRGGLRLYSPGRGSLLVGGGELFAPAPGVPMQVQAVADTILVRTVPQGPAEASCPVAMPAGAWQCALGALAPVGAGADADGMAGPHVLAGLPDADGWQAQQGMRPAFVQLDGSVDDWGRHLEARGLLWALCYRGAIALHWHGALVRSGGDMAFLQPGALYAPDAHESCRLDVLVPGTGLLCCFGGGDATQDGEAARGGRRADGHAVARAALALA